ncbi:unnamed protein product [Lepeophtheirus salmonis]|uniref:(salmon louse) hypothetical protein n=2 Tax=Lepeophtheirus salmonis TaxID=72036 RepID=A0A7R8CAS4_LEPSM|nr:uncharacterized protein LOC121116682 [Lepeophtheirus salmonis]CAB4054239.1 unnamed protein product [Lepeophtheirus salmonis]CAF2754066.1 unnamed protein product [Lepeophtheirus salmonis]
MLLKSILFLLLRLSIQSFVPGEKRGVFASEDRDKVHFLTRTLNNYQNSLNSIHNHQSSGLSSDGIIESRRVCKIKNMKQYKKMVTAQLEAHRCLVRDTVVRVPLPDDLIVSEAMPEFVVVPRCTGLCLDRSGCSCIPKKKRHTKVDVVINVNNSSQVCAEVKIEEHRGPCRCKCDLKDCHAYQEFDELTCKCRCKEKFGSLKSSCSSDILRHWEEDACDCVCDRVICADGFFQDLKTCMCKMIKSTCSPVLSSNSESLSNNQDIHSIEDTTTSVSKYVGVGCVTMVGLSMVLTVYYLVNKKRLETGGLDLVGLSHNNSMVGASSGSLMGTLRSSASRPAAYTITINSQSSNIDDSVIPLTENKTRF